MSWKKPSEKKIPQPPLWSFGILTLSMVVAGIGVLLLITAPDAAELSKLTLYPDNVWQYEEQRARHIAYGLPFAILGTLSFLACYIWIYIKYPRIDVARRKIGA